jgi:hypothetical protein
MSTYLPYSRHSTDIVGYVYQADIWCRDCIVAGLSRNSFDGWALPNVEARLDYIANARGVDRMDESSYDSDEFPKVIFEDSRQDGETCGKCGEEL